MIQRVLILYIQLDNTAWEDKNSTVFGYLSMLVEQGVFKKVKVNFLLVGVRNSTKTEKGLVLKEGLVLLLGIVLSQRRLSTMRGVEL